MPNYLYNGWELPALPEWDKTAFPYAVLVKWEDPEGKLRGCWLYVSDTKLKVFNNDGLYSIDNESTNDNKHFRYRSAALVENWNTIENPTFGDTSMAFCITNPALWSNFDIYRHDGTLYLAASDPVPVGGAEWKKHDVYKSTSNPASYRYNGVELPRLPDYDKEKYRYACICAHNESGVWTRGFDLFVSTEPLEFGTVNGLRGIYVGANTTTYEWYDKKTNETTNTVEFVKNTLGGTINPHAGINAGNYKMDTYGVLWANYDMLNVDGTLEISASDPVPVGGEPAWDGQTFYKVIGNKWVKHDALVPSEPLPEDEPTGEPIAYLYNGVELPDINEVWTDKVTYPCAMITRTITDGTCLLHVCGDMPYYTEQAHSTEGYEPTVIAPKPCKGFAHVDGSWVLNIEEADYGAALRTGVFELIWTNVDVMNKDNGSVYFDASDPPVPVYA